MGGGCGLLWLELSGLDWTGSGIAMFTKKCDELLYGRTMVSSKLYRKKERKRNEIISYSREESRERDGSQNAPHGSPHHWRSTSLILIGLIRAALRIRYSVPIMADKHNRLLAVRSDKHLALAVERDTSRSEAIIWTSRQVGSLKDVANGGLGFGLEGFGLDVGGAPEGDVADGVANWVVGVPGAVEGDEGGIFDGATEASGFFGFFAVGWLVELDVKGGGVGGEGETWSFVVGVAGVVVEGLVWFGSELGADRELAVVGDLFWVPGSVAVGVSVVLALVGVGVCEFSVVVEFFSWVLLVNIDITALEVVDRVLYTPDASILGLCYTDRVAKTPAKKLSVFGKVVGCVGNVGNVEILDGTSFGFETSEINILDRSSRDDEAVVVRVWNVESSGGESGQIHVCDDISLFSKLFSIIVPDKDVFGCRGKQLLSVSAEGNAVVEILLFKDGLYRIYFDTITAVLQLDLNHTDSSINDEKVIVLVNNKVSRECKVVDSNWVNCPIFVDCGCRVVPADAASRESGGHKKCNCDER